MVGPERRPRASRSACAAVASSVQTAPHDSRYSATETKKCGSSVSGLFGARSVCSSPARDPSLFCGISIECRGINTAIRC